MCKLFTDADEALWESYSKSLRIKGMVTSIRLEVFFWNVLKEIADRDSMTVNGLISKLYEESLEANQCLDNFTSFLRVCCGRYLALQASGNIPIDTEIPISSLDADKILQQENRYLVDRASRNENSVAYSSAK